MGGGKSALSLLSLALFRQTGKMLPSVNFHRNKGGGWTGLNSLPIFDLASRKRKARLSFLLLVFFPLLLLLPPRGRIDPEKKLSQ